MFNNKKLKLAIFITCLLLPQAVWGAAGDVAPEYNPLCWKKDDCVAQRGFFLFNKTEGFTTDERLFLESGWFMGETPCVSADLGKCLPAAAGESEVAFGGQRKFRDIGEFITKIYKYAVGVAGILAVVMIIISGAQYIVSGGNSEQMGSAKKRIGGALIGLFIAYASYFILNTINPALVNLRLPQTWMIRAQSLTPQYCFSAPVGTNFAEAGNSKDTIEPAGINNASFGPLEKPAMVCGKKYFIENAGGGTCEGHFCQAESNGGTQAAVCAPKFAPNNEYEGYKCRPGNVAGQVTNTSLEDRFWAGWGSWEPPYLADDMSNDLYIVCNDGYADNLGANRSRENLNDGRMQVYALSVPNSVIDENISACSENKRGGLKGFLLGLSFDEGMDVTDEFHYIGKGGLDVWDDHYGDSEDDAHFALMKPEYFFTEDEIKTGIVVNIDMKNVYDVDSNYFNEEVETATYGKFRNN